MFWLCYVLFWSGETKEKVYQETVKSVRQLHYLIKKHYRLWEVGKETQIVVLYLCLRLL